VDAAKRLWVKVRFLLLAESAPAFPPIISFFSSIR
jgi:hypothetical protein